jgi:hypothetical protein
MTTEIGNSALLRTWANDGTVTVPSNAKIDEGWLRGEQPPHEWMNYIHNILGQKINHALSRGAADWVASTEYLAGAVVNRAGAVWLALATNTNSEPTGANSNWTQVTSFEDLATTGLATLGVTATAAELNILDGVTATAAQINKSSTIADNAPGSAPLYACRAWVNFNGTGTVAIRASGNVSSITDNGTGDYTVNFATAMPDANYCVLATAGELTSGFARVATVFQTSASSVRVSSRIVDNGNAIDVDGFYFAIFR